MIEPLPGHDRWKTWNPEEDKPHFKVCPCSEDYEGPEKLAGSECICKDEKKLARALREQEERSE